MKLLYSRVGRAVPAGTMPPGETLEDFVRPVRGVLGEYTGNIDVRLPEKGNSNSHGRGVYPKKGTQTPMCVGF